MRTWLDGFYVRERASLVTSIRPVPPMWARYMTNGSQWFVQAIMVATREECTVCKTAQLSMLMIDVLALVCGELITVLYGGGRLPTTHH